MLYSYLGTHFPGANYHSVYEAGFCGYGHHRDLVTFGIDSIVINPADIPRTNKDALAKNDRRDSRMIAEALRSGMLKCIHIFDPQSEEFRGLFRSRLALAKDIRKTRGRIKSFMAYRNIEIPTQLARNPKSQQYIVWLQNLDLKDVNAKFQLAQFTERLLFLLGQRRLLEQALRGMARKRDRGLFALLQTVPGIGPITAIGIMAEIGDISRFRHIKHFASYVGLIPRVHQSGETERTGSITYRHNGYLRPLLIEAAWQAVRADPAMLAYYQSKCRNSNPKKAIVKVARKLLNRIMYVMKNRAKYTRGIT